MSDVNKVIPLGFTKLIVQDLDKVAAFYGAVCGLVEEAQADAEIAGRPIRELYFKSNPPGTGNFTLTKFIDVEKSARSRLSWGSSRMISTGSWKVPPPQVVLWSWLLIRSPNMAYMWPSSKTSKAI